jgi:hypothetical protein
VSGRLHYELDQERFRVDLFDPGKFLNFNLPVQTGTALFNATQRRIAFANAEALRFIPMSREKAGAVDEIRRSGSAPFSAEVELQAIGGGDPTGAVQSDGTLRMAVRSIRYEANNSRPGDLWPFDEATVPPPYDRTMDPPVIAHNRFDIMELKTGIPLDDLRKTVTAKFGPVVDISPSRNEDPRLKSGFGFAPDSCFAFGNKVPEIGAICVRALADERRVVRKIVVEQILEGADWDPIRLALLEKYGAMAEAARKSQTQYYAWGPEVAESTANDDRLSPHRALTASLSPVQSMMDRMAASTRVLTNLKIRMIDPDWAGSPQPPAPPAPAAQSAGRTPRL